MREGFKPDKNLTNKPDNLLDEYSFDKEAEMSKILDALSEKIKLLENKEAALNVKENDNCNFYHTCYVAKTKMGSCPCELYRE